MACYFPLQVLNPTRYFNFYNDKPILEVPCGKCIACQDSMRDSWNIRAYNEWKHCQEKGGFSMFVLLTYSEGFKPTLSNSSPFDYVPTEVQLSDPSFDFDDSCFCSPDVRFLLDRIRNRYRRKGEVRYMISSEFGGKKTKRPHYHALFHCYGNIQPVEFLEFLRGCSPLEQLQNFNSNNEKIRFCCHHGGAWPFGMVSPPTFDANIGDYDIYTADKLLVRNIDAIRYVTKYATKDFSYLNKPAITEFNKSIYRREYNYLMPKHFQSKGYGSCIVDVLQDKVDEVIGLGESLVNCIPEKLGYLDNKYNKKLTQLPRYVLNKLLYTTIPDGRYPQTELERIQGKLGKIRYRRVLTDFGIEYKKQQFDLVSLNRYRNIVDRLSPSNIETLYHKHDYFRIYINDKFGSLHNTFEFLKQFENYDPNLLGAYTLFFSGKLANPLITAFPDYESLKLLYVHGLDTFQNVEKSVVRHSFKSSNVKSDILVGDFSLKSFYSDLVPEFAQMDILKHLYNKFNSCLTQSLCQKTDKDNLLLNLLKSRFKNDS